ncbi:dTMP kinase [Streptomyces sp. NBC_01198]|uniref:dTMP kinase n=1 Tax=Streptomyces sp. NBC_01198 TaxID=2903769 RepID=UPI002E1281FE|nr:dTMP kinase [Streptomyces sp. NBC_01198]
MLTPGTGLLGRARGVQQALLVALLLIPLLIVTMALVPALIVLPFLKSRGAQVRSLVNQLTTWTRALLTNSADR